jgi:hypothetical protein
MHSQSFTNPVFQAQYFQELLPQVNEDAGLIKEAKGCMACHAPISSIMEEGHIVSKKQVNPNMSGVTCDFCHTITGYRDQIPGNGNYTSVPGKQKLGPFKRKSTWHSIYSELQTKSEFCAICHNSVNQYGLEINSTYKEWNDSRYAKEGIQCQDCHMNVKGFLVEEKPVYETGKAARTSLARPPDRSKLYTHRFPGAHSRTQLDVALTLDIKVEEMTPEAGDGIMIYIFVDNSRTGHKMPSGSAELRLLFLELNAHVMDNVIFIPAAIKMGSSGYDISGKEAFDKEILGDVIPKGSRIYRTVFVDKTGSQTVSSYKAAKKIFDNRLNPSEIRKEAYYFKIPEDVKGALTLVANLYYLPYPASFARQLGLPEPEAFVIASSRKFIVVK